MSKWPEPGVHPLTPFSVYQSLDAVNPSFLATLSQQTPYHAKFDKEHHKPESDDKRVGRALHSYILEPATFDRFWIVLPDDAPRRVSDRQRNAKNPSDGTIEAIEFWDRVASTGKDIIKAKEYDLICQLANETRRRQCLDTMAGGEAETSLVWVDPETGLLCKTRLDYHCSPAYDWNRYITDLKSSRNINPRVFENDVANFGYALAAAMRVDAWKILKNEDSIYQLLAVDKNYCVSWLKQIDDDTIEAGRNHYKAALRLTAECIEKNEWPAYEPKTERDWYIGAPAWYLQKHGVGPDMIRPEPTATAAYTVGPEPETQDDFDKFMEQ